ncbi:glycosyl transferase group 1 [Coriobacterium glomerans PW2]|uniref:Glycosyl transferase group 1 n=1 Tax=Coriobacterium glomerans (strain ATCC 49209 / DSM 20642 / JCM 10262 / PW2) TaxID=700015 RepID=F2N848_CORGP|nr:glycosyltransferase family 4 protein [Coriobacterium glomerans]AEB07231.1 glycosyl transferase group 1 [Coriobacterium glomerans PW2]
MRVAFFSAHYLPHVGGIETYTEKLSNTMADMGNEVVIVTNNLFNSTPIERNGSIEIVRLPCFSFLSGRYPIPNRNAEYKRLINHIERQSFSGIVINARFYLHTLAGVHFAENQNSLPVIIDHGSAYLSFGNSMIDPIVRLYENAITRHLTRHPAAYYGVSDRSVDWLSHFGITARGTIPYAIDVENYQHSASKRNFRQELGVSDSDVLVVFTGRLESIKGIQIILEVADRLRDQAFHCYFTFAGEGSLIAEIKRAAVANPKVSALGRLDNADVAALMRDADLLLLPSRSEGFGASMIEAGAMGTPIMATDVGVASELVINGSGGWIINRNDIQGVVNKISSISADKCLLAEKGSDLQRYIKANFTWKSTAKALIEACEKANYENQTRL